MSFFCIFLWIGVLSVIHTQSVFDCSDAESSCLECLKIPMCAWCDNPNGRSCIPADASKFMCPQQLNHFQCPNVDQNKNKEKLEKVFQLLSSLKLFQSEQKPMLHDQSETLESSTDFKIPISKTAQASNILNDNDVANTDSSSSTELKELLHKLMLLKLLRKLKQSGGSLSEDDRKLLMELTSSSPLIPQTTAKTTMSLEPSITTNEFSNFLQILYGKENGKKLDLNKIFIKSFSPEVSTSTPSTFSKILTTTVAHNNEEQLSASNHHENVQVDYSESESDKILQFKRLPKNFQTPNTFNQKMENTPINNIYCPFLVETQKCNNNQNCTWCNTMDSCISRTSNDYGICVESKSKLVDGDFGLDPCLSLSGCKECVLNEKCYWCDQSKSCHTYPFFGFIPQSCGGDWYVKQCDVQLAVIVIILPLMIILIALITFYFCLKYCYYRKKVLRVPLFEKPGVFDYRKDKKVYYVNPDDESSTDEFAAEKFRKKFRLPIEKEPLIDPNT